MPDGGCVPSDCAAQYVADGYCVLRRCVGAAAVAALRRECDALLLGAGAGGGPVDLDDTDCVVDLWAAEPVPPPPARARAAADARWSELAFE